MKSKRDKDHSQQECTSSAEGWHFGLKSEAKKQRRGRGGRTVPWFIDLFFSVIEPRFRLEQFNKRGGALLNVKQEQLIRVSIERAKAVPLSSITVQDPAKGDCSVPSKSRAPLQHEVRSALGRSPVCTCPVGLGGVVCKHCVACMLRLGHTETEIFMLHGSLMGSAAVGAATKLGFGIVGGSAGTAAAAVAVTAEPGAAAVVTAAVQRAERPVDHLPAIRAGIESMWQLLEGKPGHCPLAREIRQGIDAVVARATSTAARKSLEQASALRALSTSTTARPGTGLKRQLQLFEVVQKDRRGCGAKRVAALPEGAVEPPLRPLRQVRRDAPKAKKSFNELLGPCQAPDAAQRANEQVQLSSLMGAALAAVGQPPEERLPFVELLLGGE